MTPAEVAARARAKAKAHTLLGYGDWPSCRDAGCPLAMQAACDRVTEFVLERNALAEAVDQWTDKHHMMRGLLSQASATRDRLSLELGTLWRDTVGPLQAEVAALRAERDALAGKAAAIERLEHESAALHRLHASACAERDELRFATEVMPAQMDALRSERDALNQALEIETRLSHDTGVKLLEARASVVRLEGELAKLRTCETCGGTKVIYSDPAEGDPSLSGADDVAMPCPACDALAEAQARLDAAVGLLREWLDAFEADASAALIDGTRAVLREGPVPAGEPAREPKCSVIRSDGKRCGCGGIGHVRHVPLPAPCRACSECDGNHHWIDGDMVESTHVCKHCDAIGDQCEACDGGGEGDGGNGLCVACAGYGVILRAAAVTPPKEEAK